jgi:hypothetical protein
MSNKVIRISPTLEVSLEYSDGLSRQVVSAASSIVIGVATALVEAGLDVTGAIAQKVEETKVKLAFYRERGYYLREYIIPTIALFEVAQLGRNIINSSRWDADLKQSALRDLERALERHRLVDQSYQEAVIGDQHRELALLEPPFRSRRIKRRHAISEAAYQSFLSSAGAWKGLVDTKKLKRDILESRNKSSRPRIEL